MSTRIIQILSFELMLFIGSMNAYAQATPELLAPQFLSGQSDNAFEQVVVYTVQWPGDPGAWLIAPPEMPTVTWGSLELAAVEVLEQDGLNTLIYRVGVKAEESGEFEVPTLNFHFQEGTAELAKDENGVVLAPQRFMKSAPISVSVFAPSAPTPSWVYGAAAVVFVVIFMGGAFYWVRRKPKNAVDAGASLQEQLIQSLHQARRLRLDGDFYAFYKTLCEVAGRTARMVDDGPALLTRLQERTQAVGYRGFHASDETMDADWREVERAVARYRENTP